MSDDQHPHEHTQEVVPPKYLSFLREIRNTDLSWNFQMLGGVTVRGQIVDFLWNQQGIPITLMVLQKDRVNPVEILWENIQIITLWSKTPPKAGKKV